jgi:hypothetical protein
MHCDVPDREAFREDMAASAGGSRGFENPHAVPPGQGDGHDVGFATRCVGSMFAFLSWPSALPVRAVHGRNADCGTERFGSEQEERHHGHRALEPRLQRRV